MPTNQTASPAWAANSTVYAGSPVNTTSGAATMMRETGQHPTVLREQVTSPGGTTAAALRQLDDHKVRAAFITAMEAAANRSHELASGND